MTSVLENQLWLWLEDCESRKPRAGMAVLESPRQGGTVVAGEVREGSEAKEAEDVSQSSSSKLQ